MKNSIRMINQIFLFTDIIMNLNDNEIYYIYLKDNDNKLLT